MDKDSDSAARSLGRAAETSQQNQPINDKPKRKCSEKQLAALRAGRAKNSRFKPKSDIKPSKDSQ